MEPKFNYFIAGMILTTMIGMIINTLPFSYVEKYHAAIRECEKSLPRDQHCVVIGIPEKK